MRLEAGPMLGPEAINRTAGPRADQCSLRLHWVLLSLSFLQQYLEFKTFQTGSLEKFLASEEKNSPGTLSNKTHTHW